MYTVKPGRHIYKDGKPFVYISIPTLEPSAENGYVTGLKACKPTEADALTHRIAKLLNIAEG